MCSRVQVLLLPQLTLFWRLTQQVEEIASEQLRVALPVLASLESPPPVEIEKFSIPQQWDTQDGVDSNSFASPDENTLLTQMVQHEASNNNSDDPDSEQRVHERRRRRFEVATADDIVLYEPLNTQLRSELSTLIEDRLILKCTACHAPTEVRTKNGL